MNITSPIPNLKKTTAEAPSVVLTVDDSRAQRSVLTRTIGKWGYTVVEAASGEEALQICKSTVVDIIVSDWMMPGMSGVEFCKKFRELASDHAAYFILLTAQTNRDALVEGLESGADDFLSKPFNAVELRARIRAGERVIQTQRGISVML
jgi:sigma-B regulation protein RsbU (phosphoserine phosphatase)